MTIARSTRRILVVAAVSTFAHGCRAPVHQAPLSSAQPRIRRGPGAREYEFISHQESGPSRTGVKLRLTLVTNADGSEVARLTRYESSVGDGSWTPGVIQSDCLARMKTDGVAIAVLSITPPPHEITSLIPSCVPEDLFGAATDVLPLLMIQQQPRFRASELAVAGDRLRFGGYVTSWQRPPTTLDARIVADSGVVRLDSVSGNHAVVVWDTSPMDVAIVRQLTPSMRALLVGHEWFVARVDLDPRTGELLEARTLVDSLVLGMTAPFPETGVPAQSPVAHGPQLTIRRWLTLSPVSAKN